MTEGGSAGWQEAGGSLTLHMPAEQHQSRGQGKEGGGLMHAVYKNQPKVEEGAYSRANTVYVIMTGYMIGSLLRRVNIP